MKITQVIALDNDILEVHGFDEANPSQELIAQGWQSAMTNFFDPSQYDTDSNLIENAVAREMTDLEKQAYWIDLLVVLVPMVPNEPVILFQDAIAQAQLDGEGAK